MSSLASRGHMTRLSYLIFNLVWIFQIEKNCCETTNNKTVVPQTWIEQQMTSLGWAEIVFMYVASVINYRLTEMYFTDLRQNNLERIIFVFFGEDKTRLKRILYVARMHWMID